MTLHEVDNLFCEVNTVKKGIQVFKLGIRQATALLRFMMKKFQRQILPLILLCIISK